MANDIPEKEYKPASRQLCGNFHWPCCNITETGPDFIIIM